MSLLIKKYTFIKKKKGKKKEKRKGSGNHLRMSCEVPFYYYYYSFKSFVFWLFFFSFARGNMIHYLFYFFFSCRMLLLEESLSLLQSLLLCFIWKTWGWTCKTWFVCTRFKYQTLSCPCFCASRILLLCHGRFQRPNFMYENFKDVWTKNFEPLIFYANKYWWW
jgi:hypothetical protein